MTAFLTGSRVYGRPRKESDVDLVVRVSPNEAQRLRKLAHNVSELVDDEALLAETVRFGRLNLILCTTDDQFAAWRVGTAELTAGHRRGEPASRAFAIRVFQRIFRRLGLHVRKPSGN